MSILDQIAEEAGVSKMTVSRILSGKSTPVYRKARERAKQVRSIADRLNYRPNAAAKAIVTGKFHCATLLIIPERLKPGSLLPWLMDGLCDELAEQNYHLTVSRLLDEEMTDQSVPKVLRENMSDGLLVNYVGQVPERIAELIRLYQIPSIYINLKQDADCVIPDDYGGAKAATQRLLQLGHRRILYLRVQHQVHYSAVDRREGYLAAMAELSLPPLVVEPGQDVSIREQARRLLQGEQPVTAVLGYSHESSQLMLELASDLALRVPRDLSLMQFGESHEVGDRNVGMVVLPWYEVGRAAVRELLEKIEQPDKVFPPLAVMPLLEDQDTVAPPPAAR